MGGNKRGVTRGTENGGGLFVSRRMSETSTEGEGRVRSLDGSGAGDMGTRGIRMIIVSRRWGREVGGSIKARAAAKRRGRTWVHRIRYPVPKIVFVIVTRDVNTRRVVRRGTEKARWWCQRDRGVKRRVGEKSVCTRGCRRWGRNVVDFNSPRWAD